MDCIPAYVPRKFGLKIPPIPHAIKLCAGGSLLRVTSTTIIEFGGRDNGGARRVSTLA